MALEKKALNILGCIYATFPWNSQSAWTKAEKNLADTVSKESGNGNWCSRDIGNWGSKFWKEVPPCEGGAPHLYINSNQAFFWPWSLGKTNSWKAERTKKIFQKLLLTKEKEFRGFIQFGQLPLGQNSLIFR